MLTVPTGDKIVRYSSNWNTGYSEAANSYFAGDMEIATTDQTSLIYTPPLTLWPPELVDDFIIHHDFFFRINAAAAGDTHTLLFWIRALDTHYGYPVDASSGSAPIANGKYFDMLKVSMVVPSVTTLGGSTQTSSYGFMLSTKLHVHCQAPWALAGGAPNSYTRQYSATDLAQTDGTQQRIFAQYEIQPGTFFAPNNSTLTNSTAAPAPIRATHAWGSRDVTGPVMQTLFPSDGGNGVNLWLMCQKGSSAGAVSMSSGIIRTSPRILRPGLVAGQIAVPYVMESEISQ